MIKKILVLIPMLGLVILLLCGCAAPPKQTGSDTAPAIAADADSPVPLPLTGKQAAAQLSPAPTATDVHRKGLQSLHATQQEEQAGSPAQAAQALVGTSTTTATGAPAANTSQPQTPVVLSAQLNPDQWQTWPEVPTLSPELKAIYLHGLELGNDPHAFSIFGDCQSQPDVFMGVYDSDPSVVRTLSPVLQATVTNFKGSFNRYQPTVKDATTEGALLWAQWNDNKEKKCTPGETPVDCELRTHKPSIVFIHVGTHWEARNRQYLETIIKKITDHGAVPILVTKADNREKDARVNHNLASLAVEYDLPLWNFWSSVQHLPDNGLKEGSDMYLNDEAVLIHRLGALRALDTVWRALQD